MLNLRDEATCALVRELAAADDSALPGPTGRLWHEMRALAVQLVVECDGATCPLETPGVALGMLAAASTLAPGTPEWGFPAIKSPRILEWDYEGELKARRLERERAARKPVVVGTTM